VATTAAAPEKRDDCGQQDPKHECRLGSGAVFPASNLQVDEHAHRPYPAAQGTSDGGKAQRQERQNQLPLG